MDVSSMATGGRYIRKAQDHPHHPTHRLAGASTVVVLTDYSKRGTELCGLFYTSHYIHCMFGEGRSLIFLCSLLTYILPFSFECPYQKPCHYYYIIFLFLFFPLPLLDYPSSTVVRNVTTQRKSEQSKGSRSHSVPSLNSIDVTMPHLSPTRTPRSNSVRGSKSTLKKTIAKMLGSHSNLTGKVLVSEEQPSSGIYKQIGGFRPHSIGGSSDCSSSSITSTHQQSELTRNDSMRDSMRSKISQGSVFSTSRQASYDSADAINISVHGGSSMVPPSDSGLRPRSIACMQRSGSSTSLRVNSVDPRYHSIATVPIRFDGGETPTFPIDKRAVYRSTKDEAADFEETVGNSSRVRPSDPGYRKIAEDLMSCSPQPQQQPQTDSAAGQIRPVDGNHHSERVKKYSGDSLIDNGGGSPRVNPYHTQSFEERQRSSGMC